MFNKGVTALTVNIATNDANECYVFDNRIDSTGAVEVMAVTPNVDTTPTKILATRNLGSVTPGWPATHAGLTLPAQTNGLSVGLTGTWYYLGFQNTNVGTFPLKTGNPAVFYRLAFPWKMVYDWFGLPSLRRRKTVYSNQHQAVLRQSRSWQPGAFLGGWLSLACWRE